MASLWPAWDAKVQWPSQFGYAVDDATGRRAYYGPEGEPGTPQQSAADSAWGVGDYAAWAQPDGSFVFYQPTYGFNEALVAALGAGLDQFIDAGLTMWAESEGMPVNSYNPFATLRTGYGEHYVPPYTAPFYPHPYAGLRATLDTLNSGANGYDQIIQAIREHLGLSGLFDAINQSAWCSGCQGGHYPNVLYNAILSGTGAPPAGSTGGTEVPPPGTVVSGGPPVSTSSPPAPASPAPADVSAAWGQVHDLVTKTMPTGILYLQTLASEHL